MPPSPTRLRCPAALALALAALVVAPVRAQHVAVVNALVDGHEGPVTIVVRGGKIRSVGPLRRPPRDLALVDAKGARVVPGRIDAWAVVEGASPVGDPRDALDPYDPLLREALAQGVTTLCLVPRAARGASCGPATVVKLRPAASGRLEVAVVTTVAAVVAGLGDLDESPLERAGRVAALEAALEEAGRYREEWASYEEALTEWQKKQGIGAVESAGATSAAVDSRGGAAAVDTRGGAAPVGSPTPGMRPRRGPRRPAPDGTPQPGPRPPTPRSPGAAPDPDAERDPSDEVDPDEQAFHVPDQDEQDPGEPPDPPRPRRGRRGPAPGPDAPPAEPGQEPPAPGAPKPGEPPRRPRVDRGKALLARVIAREVPLLVHAERAEDVLSALELQDRFRLRLILVGLSEAHLVTDALRGREELALVLGPQDQARPPGGADPAFPPGEGTRPARTPWSARQPLRARHDALSRLAGLDLPLAVGSGALAASRFVELNAKLAAGNGLPRAAAEAAISGAPARILGLGERLGRIVVDADADLVVLGAADPAALGAPPAPVLVLIDGALAWKKAP